MSTQPRYTTAPPRHLSIAYALLVVYACLNPFSGWRETGLPLLDFLSARGRAITAASTWCSTCSGSCRWAS